MALGLADRFLDLSFRRLGFRFARRTARFAFFISVLRFLAFAMHMPRANFARSRRCRRLKPKFRSRLRRRTPRGLRHRTAGRPVEQLDRMHDRDARCRAPICVMQPILPAAITSGWSRSMLATLRSRNLLRQLRLKNVVGAGRAATQMTFRYIFDDEARLGKQFFRFARRSSGRAAANRPNDRRR